MESIIQFFLDHPIFFIFCFFVATFPAIVVLRFIKKITIKFFLVYLFLTFLGIFLTFYLVIVYNNTIESCPILDVKNFFGRWNSIYSYDKTAIKLWGDAYIIHKSYRDILGFFILHLIAVYLLAYISVSIYWSWVDYNNLRLKEKKSFFDLDVFEIKNFSQIYRKIFIFVCLANIFFFKHILISACLFTSGYPIILFLITVFDRDIPKRWDKIKKEFKPKKANVKKN